MLKDIVVESNANTSLSILWVFKQVQISSKEFLDVNSPKKVEQIDSNNLNLLLGNHHYIV
jgi:hypothetical protein